MEYMKSAEGGAPLICLRNTEILIIRFE